MGPRHNSTFRSQNYFHRLSKSLEFAVSEWILIFLLFIDACFAYLITKFASYCQLQGPCVLCSRFDLALANKKTGIHRDSICNHHKSELSSVVLPRAHGICEKCLFPFVTMNKSNASELLLDEHTKNEKNIFVDESLESFRPTNQITSSSEVDYQKVNLNSDSEPTWPPRTGEMTKNPITESEPFATSNGHQVSNFLDLGDAYKLAISSKGRQLSEKLLDQKSFQDSSTRVSEDLKLLLTSPKPSFNSDDLTGIQFLLRRISLERNESSLSLDGSMVSEIDGESVVDRLKRQVEHDKKVMGVLYKELEEERSASAVATNQAMAMITRLQEEKAALYTEALQYLRMMEEQAEYNSEALQKANDVIEEKERQIQGFEEILGKASEDVRE